MTTRRGWGRAIVALAAVVGMAAGCTGTETISGSGGPGPVALDDVRLVSYDSCDGLLEWFHTEAGARVGAYGLDGGAYPTASRSAAEGDVSSSAATAMDTAAAPAKSADETSTTNTQEPGIGEPDLAWTDGHRLVTVVTGRLEVVDLDRGSVTATIDISDPDGGGPPIGLLVDGDHAVVIEGSSSYAYDMPAAGRGGISSSSPVSSTSTTRLVRVDLGAIPAVVGTISVEGEYVDARMIDGVVRAVVRSSPAKLGFVYPSGSGQAAIDRATAANRQVIAASTIDDWLPTMTVDGAGREGTTTPAVDCSAVDHPAAFGGFGVVTVLGLDLGAGAVDPLPAAAVVADAQTVYASGEALYLATTRWPSYGMPSDGSTTTTALSPEEQQLRTDVHSFSLPTDAAARYQASGSVPGQLLNQFALSEHDGDLRVATTTQPTWGGGPITFDANDGTGTLEGSTAAPSVSVSESRITVLRPDGDALTPIGEVTGLGPSEQIRGVRFAGPTAYVVTFRQTDPLFVVDLSDPASPRRAGELKIPGYSSYLQDLGDGRVLGIGQDATTTGRQTGFQESLFDISDPANPERLAQLAIPQAQSLAESNHHALLWWAPDRLLAVPVTNWALPSGGITNSSGVLVTRVTEAGIEQVGTVIHPPSDGGGRTTPDCPPKANCVLPAGPRGSSSGYPTQIDRTLVADGRLVTVSTAGVKINDLTTLADQAWIPFT